LQRTQKLRPAGKPKDLNADAYLCDAPSQHRAAHPASNREDLEMVRESAVPDLAFCAARRAGLHLLKRR
jgi:hypothetical protein